LALYLLRTIALGTDKVETASGVVIVKIIDREVLPNFSRLCTVMLAVLASAMFALGTLAHRRLAVTCVVFKDAPFHCKIDADEKFDPVAVRVKLPPPATALVGDTLLKTGSFFLAGPTLIGNMPPTGAFFESAASSGTASQTNTRTRYNVVFIKASPV
jgi:hypothetical protein